MYSDFPEAKSDEPARSVRGESGIASSEQGIGSPRPRCLDRDRHGEDQHRAVSPMHQIWGKRSTCLRPRLRVCYKPNYARLDARKTHEKTLQAWTQRIGVHRQKWAGTAYQPTRPPAPRLSRAGASENRTSRTGAAAGRDG